ncbi:MAG: hypothetical protein R3C52_13155 [Hyphomonadaceae bacterium]
MRIRVSVLSLTLVGAACLSACAGGPPQVSEPIRHVGLDEAPAPPAIGLHDNDCAVIAAVAKQHYQFGPDTPPPPLRGENGYAPACDWKTFDLAFTPWTDGLRYVAFAMPVYDAEGATVETSIMHGPLAGTGYSCRLALSVDGWRVSACTQAWVN